MKQNMGFAQSRKVSSFNLVTTGVGLLSLILLGGCKNGPKGSTTGDSTAVSTTQTPPREIPLEDFFKNPEKRGFAISPSGTYIGYMAPVNGRMNIFVAERGKLGEAKAITAEKDRDIANFNFDSDNRIIFSRDFGGDENFHVFTIGVDGSNQRDMTPFPKVRAEVIDQLPEDDAHVLISHNKRDARYFDVYKLNTATGAMTLVAQNPANVDNWITDYNGDVRAAVQTDGVNSKILYRDGATGPFKTIVSCNFKETMAPAGFMPDNKGMYMISNRGRDMAALFEFDPTTGKEGKLLFESKTADVKGVDISRKERRADFVSYEDEFEHSEPLNERATALKARLKELIGHEHFYVASSNKAENMHVIGAYGDREGGTIYLFDEAADKLEKLADVRPWLKKEELSPMQPITFTTRDGMKLQAYLTLPAGREPKNLPVVMNVHGGPWARDSWGYDPEVQFLANRGYAVLQVNFRGSTGLGRKYWESSFKQWGRTMQNDISDGVAYLVDHGIANPKRVAIYGGSYGGYATLAGITMTPELYTCAIDYVGVSNMFTFMNTIPPYWESFRTMMYEMVGDPKKDSLLLAEVSPALHTDKIVCPLFVAQGANDPRVNKAESDQIVENLKKRGVDVEYMVKDNEGHGFRNEENRFEFYRAMETFLGKHMKEGAPAAKSNAGI
jgi:dipeptidyl aminopeptidase/acylaminoacyl peptidase